MKDLSKNGFRSLKKDVFIIGDVLMDYQYWVDNMPHIGEDTQIIMFNKNSGGSAANTAIALKHLNVSCAFCGRIGRDEIGQEILKQIQSVGLDITCMQYGDYTGYTLTIIDKNGERTMFSFRGTAKEPFNLTQELICYLQNAKLLLISGYLLTNDIQADFILNAIKISKNAGGIIALDPSPNINLVNNCLLEETLASTDILLPNERELQIMGGADDTNIAMEKLLVKTPCIAVKLGPKGSTMLIRKGLRTISGYEFKNNEKLFAPAEKVVPIDTTGAGDAFNAGFIYSFLKGDKPIKWLESGNQLASKVIMKKGAVSLYLDKD
ncbi:carbohydrate kinase family protein [Tepidanaerobacter acetatoxydans]|uniref:carbohydrate kinase family protein n=1 Tax=Tepidanaerobacter acetatoxydans TaxID=499229 RepID=UPI001BD3FCE3